ncbi:MAG: hypothetical protein HY674_02335, partial [Chloroflexi bacterium]|nr:hypothetical protein [Chloroflexota bacterium]
LWYVAQGVERLVKWVGGEKIVWNCIECTRIQNRTQKATPHQVRGEVWMSVIHGSRGLIYFVHEWEPKFDESALLSDPGMLAAVTAINRQISQLAPVLNRPTLQNVASVTSENEAVPIAIMLKRHEDAAYLFAVGMRDGATAATFKITGLKGERAVEVIGENRTVPMKEGLFQDRFQAWDAHIYRFPVNKSDDL